MTFLYPRERMKLKAFLHKRQGGLCCYCGCATILHPPPWPHGTQPPHDFATLEHLRRKSEGGTNHPDNVAIACWQCNNDRGEMSWVEFKTLKVRSRLLTA